MTARRVREQLLASSEALIAQSVKLALHGDDGYKGDTKILSQLVKMVSPLMALADDRVKVTTKDKQTTEDAIIEMVMANEIEPGYAKDLLMSLQAAANMGELREITDRLEALAN